MLVDIIHHRIILFMSQVGQEVVEHVMYSIVI